MIVLDTHAWLWWTSDPGRLSASARSAIDASGDVGVCTISCWEVAMLVSRGRVELDRDVAAWVRQALARNVVRSLPLTADVAVGAGLLDREGFPGDPADRIIYATARSLGSPLATRDEAIRSFDPARALW